MTKAMPFLQEYDITFLRPPAIEAVLFVCKIPPAAVPGVFLHKRGGGDCQFLDALPFTLMTAGTLLRATAPITVIIVSMSIYEPL